MKGLRGSIVACAEDELRQTVGLDKALGGGGHLYVAGYPMQRSNNCYRTIQKLSFWRPFRG